MKDSQLSEMTESEFLSTSASRRLFTHEHARRFAVVTPCQSNDRFAMSWRSDLIEPSVVVDEANHTTWIAVDERIAGIKANGQIIFSITTHTPILSLQKFSAGIVVISEAQAIVINCDCSIRSIHEFPDIVQDFHLEDDALTVMFTDANPMTYSL